MHPPEPARSLHRHGPSDRAHITARRAVEPIQQRQAARTAPSTDDGRSVISGDPSRGNPPHSPKRLDRATAASARRGPNSRRRRLRYHALTARAHRLSSTLRKPGTLRDQITAGICVGLDSGEDGTPSDRRIAKSACRFAASMRQHAIGCDDRSRQGGLAYRLQKIANSLHSKKAPICSRHWRTLPAPHRPSP